MNVHEVAGFAIGIIGVVVFAFFCAMMGLFTYMVYRLASQFWFW